MTDQHGKGKRKEREFGEWLMGEGRALAYAVVPRAKWGSEDLFGCFDLVYVSQDGQPVFAQICSKGGGVARHKRDITAFVETTSARFNIELWSYDAKGWHAESF